MKAVYINILQHNKYSVKHSRQYLRIIFLVTSFFVYLKFFAAVEMKQNQIINAHMYNI